MTGNSKVVAAAAPRPKPPAAGIGRKPGVQNKTTVAVKQALQAVYADLQNEEGGDNAHLLAWAKGNPGEFYKLWCKMLPTEISGPGGGPIPLQAELVARIATLAPKDREQLRALAHKMDGGR